MLINTYVTDDSNNVVNKKLELIGQIDIKFKDEVNFSNPLIILNSKSNEIDFNYVYIDKFKRYYYVDNIKAFPNNIIHIGLVTDVLMSYKDDILKAYADISSQSNFNSYYNFNYSSEVRKESDKYYSDTDLVYGEDIILTTIGGI